MKVDPVDPTMVAQLRPELEPLLLSAMRHGAGEMSLRDILQRCGPYGDFYLLVGRFRPQGAVCAVFVVAEVAYPQFKALRVVVAAGEPLDRWIAPLVATLERRCAIIDAEQIEFFGRPGFRRKLAEWADHTYTVMVRKVRDGRKRDRNEDRTAA